MVLGLGMRTIWISLRAMNYTDRAFKAAIRSLGDLEKEEKKHINILLAQKDAARMNVQMGLLYGATTAMVAGSIFNLVSQTEAGAEYMEEFNNTLQETKVAFADTLFEALKPFLDVFKGFMEVIRDNEPVRKMVLAVGGLAIAFMGVYSASLMLKGTYEGLQIAKKLYTYLTERQIISEQAHTISIGRLQTSYWGLAAATAAAFASFIIFYDIFKGLDPIVTAAIAILAGLAAALWAVYVAESAATMGIAGVLGGVAAAAAAVTAQSYLGQLQMGTASVPFTGPYILHKGEIVYNPKTERPTGVAKDFEGREYGKTNIFDTKIVMENVNTKSDVEEMDEKIRRSLRDLAREA